MKKYEEGDIVFVSKYDYDGGTEGKNHLFVVIDTDNNNLVPIEYFGLIVSSHIEKSKEKSNFKFNEIIKKNSKNGLKTDSIVKCDQLYSIPAKHIQFKIGEVDIADYLRFMETYNTYLEELNKQLQNV